MKVTVDETLREEQAGFRKDRLCIDQIATLRIIVEQAIEWSYPCTTLFVDFENVFDSLDRDAMWKILPVIMVYLIKSSTCLRFRIRALLAKCFLEEL